jgi:hypothetical protein
VQHVLAQTQREGKIGGVLEVTGEGTPFAHKSLFPWLKSRLGVPETYPAFFLGELISRDEKDKPVVIVFDQFDHLMAHDNCSSFVTSMAENSVKEKSYTVLLVLTQRTLYQNILNWNGGQKIRPCLSNFKHFTKILQKEKPKEFFDAWAKAGTPGYMMCTRFSTDLDDIQEEVEGLSHLWPREKE